MVTRVKDFDLSISCTLQCLGCVVIALKPEQRVFVKKGKDVVWLVLASHCQLYMYMQSFPSRLLIVDARLCFMYEGADSDTTWLADATAQHKCLDISNIIAYGMNVAEQAGV